MSDATPPSRDVSAKDRGQIANLPDNRASEAALPNNLPPQLTSFVGREREVVDLREFSACSLLRLLFDDLLVLFGGE